MKRFLVIQTAFIGDVILVTSFIESLHQNFPHAKIDFVLRQGNEHLLANCPLVDNTFVWNKKKKWSSLLQVIREVRKFKYDSVFTIQRFFNAGLISLLSKAKHKSGFKQNPLSFFFTHKTTHKIPHYLGPDQKSYLHETQRNLQLLSSVYPKIQNTNNSPKLYFNQAIEDKVSALTTEKKYIVLAPTSVWYTKQWSVQRWRELATKLCLKYDLYFIGAPADFTTIERIIKDIPRCHNYAGKLSLLESAKLMENARRVFVNDSAPLHLASAVNARTTAIFCSTIKDFGYFPLSDDSTVVEYKKKLECRPCGLHGRKSCPLKHFNCSLGISVDEVMNTLEEK